MGLMDFLTGGPKKDPVHLTDGNFGETVMKPGGAWVIDFWGPSCSWCTKMVPTIRILGARYDGKVGFGEVDVSSSPGVAARFSVKGTPTLAFVKDGKIVERLVGFHPENYIEEVIAAHFDEFINP
jgi:thioredoxin 1